ncbi:MAG: hypothetical protein BVN32_11080 [Proteobacteria bacterium ST_bin14]|nr:MAG: hypothetical protein BVN32_11080 [Proteobacteria bacterium ST_bin14]
MTKDIADLARRWSRAIARGRGIRIEAADLDLLTDIGVNDIIQAAAAQKLKELAKWRADQRSAGSTDAATTGLTGTGCQMEISDPRISPSSGMIRNEDASALLAHALQISQPQGRR